ncbi:probable leucine-rich repeat receptor-like serine/threonine-protein kinase [Tanacetum coccineum]
MSKRTSSYTSKSTSKGKASTRDGPESQRIYQPVARPPIRLVSRPRSVGADRGVGRGGSSGAASNGDRFADDQGDIGEYIDKGNRHLVRPRGIHGGRGGSSSGYGNGDQSRFGSSATGEGDRIADDYVEDLDEGMIELDMESSQRRRSSNIADTPPTKLSQRSWIYPYQNGFTEPRDKYSDLMEEKYGADRECHPRVGTPSTPSTGNSYAHQSSVASSEEAWVHTLMTDEGLVVHMLIEKKYPLKKEILMQMLKLKLESEEESTMALELIRFIKKSWLVQDQTVLGKDYSNLLIADSLLKTIWFINAPCYDNEALASPNTNDEELSIPEQTATGKGTSNPLMAGSLPKTTKPTGTWKRDMESEDTLRRDFLYDFKVIDGGSVHCSKTVGRQSTLRKDKHDLLDKRAGKKVHLGIKVGENILITGVPVQEDAEGNVAEKKKIKEFMGANIWKLLKYKAWSTRWSAVRGDNSLGCLSNPGAAGTFYDSVPRSLIVVPLLWSRVQAGYMCRISGNSLSGKILEFIGKWNNLDSLRIQASGLEGPIPSSITLLPTLTDLRISDLNGPDTLCPPFINTTSFKNLILRSCNLIGNLPESLSASKVLLVVSLIEEAVQSKSSFVQFPALALLQQDLLQRVIIFGDMGKELGA